MDVNHELLATKLKELDGLRPDSRDLLRMLESFLRTARAPSVEPQFVTIEGHRQRELG